ncbi:hypothetical protein EV1_030407 [Malus domestica]
MNSWKKPIWNGIRPCPSFRSLVYEYEPTASNSMSSSLNLLANRQSLIDGFTGSSWMVNTIGHLVILENNQTVLDNGNLVLRDEKDTNSENYLLQSFDYPFDTLLPAFNNMEKSRQPFSGRLYMGDKAAQPF